VVGIDMAGPEQQTFEQTPDFKRYVALFQEAREHGLGITVHTGETDATGPESLRQVLMDIKRPKMIICWQSSLKLVR